MVRNKQKENEWSQAFSAVLRRQGAELYPCIASQWAPAGWPDLHVVHRMWTGLIERKASHTALGPHQLVRMREINLRRPLYSVIARHIERETLVISSVSAEGTVYILFECQYDTFLRSMRDYVAAN